MRRFKRAIWFRIILLASMLLPFAGCATMRSGPSASARLAAASADFDQARAFAAPFLAFLPPERAALVRAMAEIVEQALFVARSATTPAVREDALRDAERATADYRLVTGG